MRKRIHFSAETFRHKWPVFAIGFANGEFFLSLWLVDIRLWMDY
jgi:hypothetical protein